MSIHINIDKLIAGKVVENERIEYKKGWNPDAIYRTICAFANDFENIGGGYIVVGAEEENGMVKRPIVGIPDNKLDTIQKEMIGYNKLIRPYYAPRISIEKVDDKNLLVIWVPGGNDRPYEVPDNITSKYKKYNYYIRKYASSVNPSQDEKDELLSLSNKIPFDDRPNRQASIDDISPLLVQEYLNSVDSRLHSKMNTSPLKEIYQSLDLLSGPDELLHPKNIALMMFNHRPDKFFPYSRIEIVEFPNGLDSPIFYEKPYINGPIQYQIHNALEQLKNLVIKEYIHKVKGKADAERIWNYPFGALEEAVVNSVYHRSYEVREPIEIRILPDAIEIINYGGPDRSVKLEDIRRGIIRNRRYRNRRIGDFLKELNITEGRGTGIPTIREEMAKNGSPEPRFETDDNYSFFITTLPIHPIFLLNKDSSDDVNQENIIHLLKGEVENELVNLLVSIPGLNAVEMATRMEKSISTVERYLRQLRKKGLVEFRGVPKTGGYYLTEKMKSILDKK